MATFNVTKLTPQQETIYKAVLNNPKGASAKDLASKLNLELTAVSKHLTTLHQLGGIARRMEGQALLYSPLNEAQSDTPPVKAPAKKAATKVTTNDVAATVKDEKEVAPAKKAAVKAEPKKAAVKAPAKKAAAKVEAVEVETAATDAAVEAPAPVKVDKRKQLATNLRGAKPLKDKAKVTPDVKFIKTDGTINFKKAGLPERGEIVTVPNRFTKEDEVAVVIDNHWNFWAGKFAAHIAYVSDGLLHDAYLDKITASSKKVAKAKIDELLAAHKPVNFADWKKEACLKALQASK